MAQTQVGRRQKAFADELRDWRERADLTQEEAAEFLGVPLGTYKHWEQGRQEPDQKGPIRKVIELS